MRLTETPPEYMNGLEAFQQRRSPADRGREGFVRFRPAPKRQQRQTGRRLDFGRLNTGLPEIDRTFDFGSVLGKSLAPQAPITVTVNGVGATTILPGDSVVIVITFSDGAAEAEASFWVDVDGDGALNDTIDINVEEGGHVVDNGFEDEDTTSGVFKITLFEDEEEGLLSVTNLSIILLVEDAGGQATALITIAESPTAFSVSGTVTPAVANVIIAAFPYMDFNSTDGPDGGGPDDFFIPALTVTDTLGAYTIYLDAADTVTVEAFDELGVQDGLISDTTYDMVVVTTAVIGIDFNFIPPTSFITGTVADQLTFPVEGVFVFAGGEGFGYEAETDVNGNYSIGVRPGFFYVNVEDVIPAYMGTDGQMVDVLEGGTAIANFTIYEASSTISGTVTLNGDPLGGVELSAWGYPSGSMERGMWTFTESDPLNGTYTLHVSDAVDAGGYSVMVDRPPFQTFGGEAHGIIPPVSDLEIALFSADGGISGAVTVAGSAGPDTLFDAWVYAMDVTKDFEIGAPVDYETGTYTLYLPPGSYDVGADAEGYFPSYIGPITVANSLVTGKDIALTLISFDGAIEGLVTDFSNGSGLPDVQIGIWNEALNYYDETFTDSTGFYHFEVPNGMYEIWAERHGYFGDFTTRTVNTDNQVANFALEKWTFEPPYIIDIRDNPDDQGRWVLINFNGGATQNGPMFGWSIWSIPGPDYFPEQMVNVGFFLAAPQEAYTVLVPTFVDSNSTTGGNPAKYQSWFVITGFGDENNQDGGGGLFFADSEPFSGWSVDNIQPGVPGSPALSIVAGGFELSWDASVDADFQFYSVSLFDVTDNTKTLIQVADNMVTLTSTELVIGHGYDFSIAAVDYNGNFSAYTSPISTTSLAIAEGLGTPSAFALLANYPNPFNPSTNIQFEIPEAARVNLQVYDLTGRSVKTLVADNLSAGYHTVVWDGHDSHGRSVATGVYFYRIVAGDGFTATRKMVFMK